jgi:hypothetical protein
MSGAPVKNDQRLLIELADTVAFGALVFLMGVATYFLIH